MAYETIATMITDRGYRWMVYSQSTNIFWIHWLTFEEVTENYDLPE